MRFDKLIGQTLDGKYKVEKQLGKGGMGTVYLATHIGTERPVAIKVIASEFMERAEFIERFRREARAAGRLRHPNVVDVTDFGFSATSGGEVAYLVMEYLDGVTLGEVLEEEKQLPLSWSVDIIEQVCSAVHEAHLEGIIHRDLKPDNIWLEPNQRGGYTVKVLDFGIAKLEEEQQAGRQTLLSEADDRSHIDKKDRLPDVSSARTLADSPNSTSVSDRETIQQNPAKHKVGSRSTIVSGGEDAGETLAAIRHETLVAAGDGAEEIQDKKTKLMQADDDSAATKLIPDVVDTNRPNGSAVETDRSLIDPRPTAELTRVGAVMGTPLYMSPEQCRGERLTPLSDIYSLGVIVYQMLSGKTPFDGSHSEVMDSHKSVVPPPIVGKKIPKKVRRVISETLSKTPEDRPRTAQGFASELRSGSEGLGVLLQRAMVIYSERLPKFLLIAVILAIPSIILTAIGIVIRFLSAADILEDNVFTIILASVFSLATLFVQISYSALLVGMTTWIVAQVIAAPLRPISVKAAFGQVRLRLKPLLKTVTVSTLLSMLGVVFFLLPGLFLAARYMLIAPSIMMEGISGRTAFKRSIELGKRSFRTVFATAFLVYALPIVFAIAISLAIAGFINSFDPKPDPEKAQAVAVQTENPEDPNSADKKSDFSFGRKVVVFTNNGDDKDKTMAGKLRNAIQQGIFELIWAPLVILFSSFTSVVTALLYFKTRQAGGETMEGLLKQFEEAECSTSKWRNRVRQRLVQSGRTTDGRRFKSGSR